MDHYHYSIPRGIFARWPSHIAIPFLETGGADENPGHVQASFNGSSLYDTEFGLDTLVVDGRNKNSKPGVDDWKLGAANASPFFFAAILGCPLALPVNHYLGRKGGMVVAAFLILVSSLASAFATNWQQLFGIRLVNGIGEHNDDSLENKHH